MHIGLQQAGAIIGKGAGAGDSDCFQSCLEGRRPLFSPSALACIIGGIIAAPGYMDDSVFAAGGNSYGTSVTVDEDGNLPRGTKNAVRHQAERTLKIAQWLKNSMS